MGSSSGGFRLTRRYSSMKNRQRANMSFFIVVIFFAIFGIILFTEIFLMDERTGGAGVVVRHGSLSYHRHQERGDYEDMFQKFLTLNSAGNDICKYKEIPLFDCIVKSEDYISIRLGGQMGDTVSNLLMGDRKLPAITLIHESGPDQKVLTETQLPPYPIHKAPLDGIWQIVNGTRFKFFVYSAYYDWRRGLRAIRIIAVTKTRGPERVWCRFWYRSNEGNSTNYFSITTMAKSKVIRENWNLKYSACFIMCPLQVNQSIPFAVSIVSRLKYPPSNLITVQNNFNETRPTNKFGVCVKPLHFDYNRALQMLEFIEFNRILGVAHFTFYNHTIGNQVSCILKDYVKSGVVSLLSWELNMISQKEIRTEGLFAALNDCLYRSMNKFSHILLIDLDEYIVPRHNSTLSDLLKSFSEKTTSRSIGSYSFQNAFFYLQWGDDETVYESKDPLETSLVTLKKTRRKSKLHPHKQRSKYICKPDLVIEAGNHFVWEYLPGYNTHNVASDSAILHHYRICEFGGDDCIKTASVVDTTVFRYRNQLINAVREHYESYRNTCVLQVLPSLPQKTFKILNIFANENLL